MSLKDVDIDALLEAEGWKPTPKQQAEIDRAEDVYSEYLIKRFKLNRAKILSKALSNLNPEELLADLKPEERKQLLKQLLEEQDKEAQD